MLGREQRSVMWETWLETGRLSNMLAREQRSVKWKTCLEKKSGSAKMMTNQECHVTVKDV